MRIRNVGSWARYLGGAFVCLGLTGLALASLALAGPALGEAGATRDQIRAAYTVGVAGIDLGTLDVTATVGPRGYALKGRGDFSILAGLFYKGTGKTESRGALLSTTPKPQRFDFSYSDNKKDQQLRILFNKGTVRSVTRTPKKKPDKKAAPLSDDQLRDVLDPLTAAFLSVHSNAPAGDPSVCDETLRVFDGKRLFDLTLSPKRTETLGGRAPKGVSAAAVCKVRYQPIGGHRPESSTVVFLQQSEDIEAWLVPVPGTTIFVPYKVVVPTDWGNGAVTLTKLQVEPVAARRANAR